MAEASSHCQVCGAMLEPGVPEDNCPACLMRLASQPSSRSDGIDTAASRPAIGPYPVFLPERIGPYRILEMLGEGGMGIVYLAEQHEIGRRVAVKVIKPGMDTSEVLARFETERQALARLDHPNVARVFDAGSTETGRPYFVMEHVPGVPITEYCDLRCLAVPERLNLFVQVCGAIQHAHQKGIIHRDIKPSNVLVASDDERATPKVIDFGIAKATDRPLSERTLFTERGVFVGTPEYMSPEQAGNSGLDVDARTDIYSLGVLLYELLVGALPFDPATLRHAAVAEMLRIIRDEDPPRPTTRYGSLGDSALEVARRRHTDVRSLARALHGDLEWITMRSLEKDPTRRYPSASELAADVERHLADEPVTAGPPSRRHRARKFIRKHRGAVAAAAALLFVLLAGVVTSTTLYMRSEASRQLAEEQAARNRLDADALQAAFRGDVDKYRIMSGEALALHRRAVGPEDPVLARYLVNRLLVSELVSLGNWTPDIQAEADEATALIERALDRGDTSVVMPLLLLQDSAHVADERIAGLSRKALDLTLRARQQDDETAAASADTLAALVERNNPESIPDDDLPGAIQTARLILGLRRRAGTGESDSVAKSVGRLSVLLAREADRLLWTGDFHGAESRYAESLGLARESKRFTETDIAKIEINLARCLIATGRQADAEGLLREGYAVLSARLGRRNAAAQQALSTLVELYETQQRPLDAAPYRRQLPAILVARIADRGPVRFQPDGTRDGGFSAVVDRRSRWVFQDTSLPARGQTPARWLDSSGGTVDPATGGRTLTISSPALAGASTVPVALIPRTSDEMASDAARNSPACREDCGAHLSFEPGPVIRDEARRRTLVFYTVNLGPNIWDERRLGSSIALWPEADGPAVRPVVVGARPGSTILFGADEPAWGSGALAVGEWLYAYGCRPVVGGGEDECLLARVQLDNVFDRRAWRFYSGDARWTDNWRLATPVITSTVPLSVHWNAYLARYVAVAAVWLSSQLKIQTAIAPEGPWSASVLIDGLTPTSGFPWIRDGLAHADLTRDKGRIETLTYVRTIGLFRSEMRAVEIEFRR